MSLEKIIADEKSEIEKFSGNDSSRWKGTSIILSFVLSDRYSTAAISSILVLFIHEKYGLDVDTSTVVFHSYNSITNLLPILGSIIADNHWGQFRTLVIMSMVFAAGSFTVAAGTIDYTQMSSTISVMVGLLITSIGAGCIKPCIQTIGGDQFKSTETKKLGYHFVMNYFVFNCGSIISRFLSPILRADVKCFGNSDCFTLAFGIPGVLMVLAALILLAGRKNLIRNKTEGNHFEKIVGCILYSITQKFSFKTAKKSNWLDHSEGKFGLTLVQDTKKVLSVLVLFLPLPLFYALLDQQGSRWVFQAKRMDGDLGWFFIKPDQFALFNPLLTLFMIPTFEFALYPLMRKIGFESPLEKATLGGFLAAVSFITSAYVEFELKTKILHILWLLPQYFFMTSAEVLITIPLMQFCYMEAPDCMKSMLAALRFVCVSFGNLIVVLVAGTQFVESQVQEFLIFAVLMTLDMAIFAFLARKYKFSQENKL